MSDVKRYWVATQALYEKEWVGVEGLVVSAGDHDAKVAELEAEIGHLKHRLEAADEWATIASEQLRGRDALAAELAALKGAAGEVPEVVAWKTPSGNLYADKAVAEAGWRGHIRKATPLMTVAQHQRIVAAMARDAEGLVGLLAWLRGAINCNAENDVDQCGAWISTKHPMIERIDAALAAHRTRNGDAPL